MTDCVCVNMCVHASVCVCVCVPPVSPYPCERPEMVLVTLIIHLAPVLLRALTTKGSSPPHTNPLYRAEAKQS